MSEPAYEPVRWYTLARRFPQLVARTPDGTVIPGGPYTVTAFGCAGALAYLLMQTWGAWTPLVGGTVTGFAISAVAVYATAWGITRLPLEGRNPISVLSGLLALLQAPREGVVPGRRRLTPKKAPKTRVPRAAGALIMHDDGEKTDDA